MTERLTQVSMNIYKLFSGFVHGLNDYLSDDGMCVWGANMSFNYVSIYTDNK